LSADRTVVLDAIKKLGRRDGLIVGLVPIMTQPESGFHSELGFAATEREALAQFMAAEQSVGSRSSLGGTP
jgi:hypothetical protein